MASTKAWVDALNKVMPVSYPDFKTTEVYQRIKKLGFKTVEWIELEIPDNGEKQIAEFLSETEKFLAANKPCLFIFDPKDSSLRKSYFVDVEDSLPIKKWLGENRQNLAKYYFLITSQISNTGNCIIGSVFSDGKGKLFCETLHPKKGSSHRLLSQPKEDIKGRLDSFTAENFELESTHRKFLCLREIKEIIDSFGGRKGYFEFVRGIHKGKEEIVVTGYEDSELFRFPGMLHENKSMSAKLRCRAAALKNT